MHTLHSHEHVSRGQKRKNKKPFVVLRLLHSHTIKEISNLVHLLHIFSLIPFRVCIDIEVKKKKRKKNEEEEEEEAVEVFAFIYSLVMLAFWLFHAALFFFF